MAEGTEIESEDFIAEFSKPIETESLDRLMGTPARLDPPTLAPPPPAPAADIGAELYSRITRNGESFWESVYEPFMARDLNRGQVRALVKKGLTASDGNYRRLLVAFRLPSTDYQRFMDFLRHHSLKP
jgi:hypothetical protein